MKIRESFSPLPRDVKIAGGSKYGIWQKEVTELTNPAMRQLVRHYSRQEKPLVLVEAGCGNGASSWTAINCLSQVRPVEAHFVDIQSEAIKQTQELVANKPFLGEVDVHFQVADLTHGVPLHPESVDVVLADHVLHFVDGNQQKMMLRELAAVMAPWAYLYIGVCSIYNAACVGPYPSPHLKDTLEHFERNGGRGQPLTQYHCRFQRNMHFLTADYLCNLLESCGFRLSARPWQLNNSLFPNGLGRRCKENIFALAQKN